MNLLCAMLLLWLEAMAPPPLPPLLQITPIPTPIQVITPLPSWEAVTLAWNPVLDTNAVGYVVYYGTDDGGTNAAGYTYALDASTNTSLNIFNLASGTNYFFSVSAYDDLGEQGWLATPFQYLAPVTPPAWYAQSNEYMVVYYGAFYGGSNTWISLDGTAPYQPGPIPSSSPYVSIVVQQSADLATWVPLLTNTCQAGLTEMLVVSNFSLAQLFFRTTNENDPGGS